MLLIADFVIFVFCDFPR